MSVRGSSVFGVGGPPASAASGTSILARPKSRILACPPGPTMMLAGFRSRWTMPHRVGHREGVGELDRDRERGERLERPSVHELLEGRALHVLQHDVVEPVRLPEVVDGLDVRVVESGAEDRLALEAPPRGLARGEIGPEGLDDDGAAEPQVVGLEGGGLASLAQRVDDSVVRERAAGAEGRHRERGYCSPPRAPSSPTVGPSRARRRAVAGRALAAGVAGIRAAPRRTVRSAPIPARLRPVLKVLVVGPESLSGALGPTVLGRPDIDRVHVEKAGRAIEAAEKARPHMIVIDLPRAEAVALVRELRENEVTRPTAIVWLNRTDPPEAETELAVAGANAVITLPVDPFLWDRRLEELLSVPARRNQRFPVRLRDWSRFVSERRRGRRLGRQHRGPRCPPREPARARARDEGGADPRPPRRVFPGGRGGPGGAPGRRGGAASSAWGSSSSSTGATPASASPRSSRPRPQPDRPGAPAAVLPLTVRPFEEAREWEEELRASEIRKALILDSALDCILTADHDGRVIEFNAAARRLFGYTRSEILGREVADTIVPPALRDELRRQLRDFVLTGENADLGRRREATAMRADGSLVPVEVGRGPGLREGQGHPHRLHPRPHRPPTRRAPRRRAPARDPGPHRLAVADGGRSHRARRPRARPRLHGGPALGGGRRSARAGSRRDLVQGFRRPVAGPPRRHPRAPHPRGRGRGLGRTARPRGRRRRSPCPSAWGGRSSGCSR